MINTIIFNNSLTQRRSNTPQQKYKANYTPTTQVCFGHAKVAFANLNYNSPKNIKKIKKLEKFIKNKIRKSKEPIEQLMFKDKELYKAVLKWLKKRVNKKRFKHLKSSEKTSRKIAKIINANQNKAALIGLIHDNSKGFSIDGLEKAMEKFDMEANDLEKQIPERMHAPVSALVAKNNLRIKDSEIFDAIKSHNAYDPKSNIFNKILFLTDKVEPKLRGHKIYKMAIKKLKNENIDTTIKEILDYKAYIKSKKTQKKLFFDQPILYQA